MGNVIEHPLMAGRRIAAPSAISPEHEVSTFDCGKPPLNDWLRTHARKSEGRSARCYVVSTVGSRSIIGYYCLATGAVAHEGAPGAMRRNMPSPTPVMVLGRLAVDKEFQGRGLGKGMLKDAMLRVSSASRIVGALALIVHAIDAESVPFYTSFGFMNFPTDMRTMYLPIETIIKGL